MDCGSSGRWDPPHVVRGSCGAAARHKRRPERGAVAILGCQILLLVSLALAVRRFCQLLLPAISVAQRIEAAIASLLMAALTYRWVEQPIRTSRCLAQRRALSLSAAAGVALLSVGASAALAAFANHQMNRRKIQRHPGGQRRLRLCGARVLADGVSGRPSSRRFVNSVMLDGRGPLSFLATRMRCNGSARCARWRMRKDGDSLPS